MRQQQLFILARAMNVMTDHLAAVSSNWCKSRCTGRGTTRRH